MKGCEDNKCKDSEVRRGTDRRGTHFITHSELILTWDERGTVSGNTVLQDEEILNGEGEREG